MAAAILIRDEAQYTDEHCNTQQNDGPFVDRPSYGGVSITSPGSFGTAIARELGPNRSLCQYYHTGLSDFSN